MIIAFMGTVLCTTFTCFAGSAAAQNALMPEVNADLSAHRIDCDVFGWNKDFTEVAALGLNLVRYPRGKQRGEGFLLVFDVG